MITAAAKLKRAQQTKTIRAAYDAAILNPEVATTINDLSFHLAPKSDNDKLRGKVKKNGRRQQVAGTISGRQTCPLSCAWINKCYGKFGPIDYHWGAVTDGARKNPSQAKPIKFDELITGIKALPASAMIRFSQVGDLPGDGRDLFYAESLKMLAAADHLAAAWTYTHYADSLDNLRAVRRLNKFAKAAVNLSANNDADADDLIARKCGPVVSVVAADDARKTWITPGGNRAVVCPAQLREIGCGDCGNGRPLCARKDRDYIVAFRIHGGGTKYVQAASKAFQLPTAKRNG